MLLGAMSIVFFAMRVLPGDPCMAMMGDQATRDALKDCVRDLGLARPVVVQYGEFLWKSIRLDFGQSFRQHYQVTDYILRMFPYTITLVLASMMIALAIGLPTGILSALKRRNPLIDYSVRIIALLGLSMPVFWFGLMLIVGWLLTFLLGLFVVMMTEAVTWNPLAKIIPLIVGSAALLFCSLALFTEVFKKGTVKVASLGEKAMEQVQQKMHMDVASTVSHLPAKTLLARSAVFFGWLIAFLMSMATIGLIPTVPLFVIAFMRLEAREPWWIVLPYAAVMGLFVYALFDQALAIPWPPSLLGDYFPDLRGVIPSV
jgi:hypothetical protein